MDLKIKNNLYTAGMNLKQARRWHEKVTNDLYKEICRVYIQHPEIPVKAIAHAADLSRQQVYNILEREGYSVNREKEKAPKKGA